MGKTSASRANKLVQVVEEVLDRVLPSKAISTIHKQAIVKELPSESNSKYLVTIDGDDVRVSSLGDLSLAVNNVVAIEYWNGIKTKPFIIGKMPKW